MKECLYTQVSTSVGVGGCVPRASHNNHPIDVGRTNHFADSSDHCFATCPSISPCILPTADGSLIGSVPGFRFPFSRGNHTSIDHAVPAVVSVPIAKDRSLPVSFAISIVD